MKADLESAEVEHNEQVEQMQELAHEKDDSIEKLQAKHDALEKEKQGVEENLSSQSEEFKAELGAKEAALASAQAGLYLGCCRQM